MYRTKTCGELRISDAGSTVTLAGWVQRIRKMGGMTFVDLRDRYGITQLVFNEQADHDLFEQANHLGREYVIQIKGQVSERSSKNEKIATGDIEIIVSHLRCSTPRKYPRLPLKTTPTAAMTCACATATSTSAARRCAATLSCATHSVWSQAVS